MSEKLTLLESQLAYVIIRFHLRESKHHDSEQFDKSTVKIPSEKIQFKKFIAEEVLKLIAFAGVMFVEKESEKLLQNAHKAIHDKENQFPALASLYKNGRLCYFYGATFPCRLYLVEEKVESIGSILGMRYFIISITCGLLLLGLYDVSQLNELQADMKYYILQREPDKSIGHASFQNMDEFYDALKGEFDEEYKETLFSTATRVFREQAIGVKQLDSLTDEKLGKAGIVQIGLREAILAVLRRKGIITQN